jgi:hypothetical protein
MVSRAVRKRKKSSLYAAKHCSGEGLKNGQKAAVHAMRGEDSPAETPYTLGSEMCFSEGDTIFVYSS